MEMYRTIINYHFNFLKDYYNWFILHLNVNTFSYLCSPLHCYTRELLHISYTFNAIYSIDLLPLDSHIFCFQYLLLMITSIISFIIFSLLSLIKY